jgi:5-methyltetrahydropteroyltriglutamate--homocysteine methyltransferase
VTTPLPLFPVTTVGSWPRPDAVLDAQRRVRRGRAPRAELDRAADAAIVDVLRLQEEAGCDLVTDGELRRDNFYSFVADKFDGVRLMTLAEMLDVVEDKAGFERLLQTLDVPAYTISTPACVGPLRRREPLAVTDLAFVRRHSDRPVKVTLPGPYLLTRAMYVAELTRRVYPSKEDLAEDVVALLRDELTSLAAAGAAFVQLDEPVLTEVALASGRTRTFMCAALAARRDPAEELEFAVSLVNRVVSGVGGTRTGVHVCRGNWSRDESTLLGGSYAPLAPYLERLQVDQLVLEYATERAGDLRAFAGKELGLGVVNPRIDTVETSAEIRAAVERALRLYEPERIFLNPDCGFGTFASRPMNTAAIALAKIHAMADAARTLRPAAGIRTLHQPVER